MKQTVIWTNDYFEKWQESMMANYGYTEDEATMELFSEDIGYDFDRVRCRLNKNLDGCVVAFGDLGLWDGHHNGGRVLGENLSSVLKSTCGDYVTFTVEGRDIRCEDKHHDGTNVYTYRLARSYDVARNLVNKIAYGGMSLTAFKRATKPLGDIVREALNI